MMLEGDVDCQPGVELLQETGGLNNEMRVP
jgi:hypothetical protein